MFGTSDISKSLTKGLVAAERKAKGLIMVNYHIVLADETQRNVRAAAVEIVDGCLVLRNDDGQVACTYSETSWLACEREFYDDKGYPNPEDPSPEPK